MMRVKVYNKYWARVTYVDDVVKVIDKTYGFELVKMGGFKKAYSDEYEYKVLKEGEYF